MMRILFSRLLAPALLAGIATTSFSALAQQITVPVTGEILEATCTPILTGTNVTANSIALEPVQISVLGQAGATANPRTITFSFVNCGMSAAINNMWVYFMNADMTGISSGGRLNTNNPNVAFQFMDVLSGGGTGNQVDVVAGPIAPGVFPPNLGTSAPLTGSLGSRAASKSYIVRYYAKAPVTTAGPVSAQVTYTAMFY